LLACRFLIWERADTSKIPHELFAGGNVSAEDLNCCPCFIAILDFCEKLWTNAANAADEIPKMLTLELQFLFANLVLKPCFQLKL